MNFFKKTKLGDDNGKYRGTSASLYGSATQGPSAGAGGAGSGDTVSALYKAYAAGTIDHAELRAGLNTIAAGMSSLSQSPYASLGQSPSAALAQAQYQQMIAMRMAMHQSMAYPGAITHIGRSSPHEPTSLKSEGMRAGEIIAWRAWHIKDDNLLSVVAEGKAWSATEPMVGDPAAGYGVHAYKTPHGPVLDNYVTRDLDKHWVIGEVAMWGDVIEHAEGYRSEFARVHSFVTWSEKVPAYLRAHMAKKYLDVAAFKVDDAA